MLKHPFSHPWRLRAAHLLVACGLLLGSAGPAAATDLSGCWEGCWESFCTGHHGPLKATFTRCDEVNYSVRFSGRFFKLIPFRYTTTLTVVEESADGVRLTGSSYLGRLMGTFSYNASATDTDFVAGYSSCKDQGQFVLRRVCCCQCQSCAGGGCNGCGCQ